MNTEFARLANDAAKVGTSGRWDTVIASIKFLAQNPGSANDWWIQVFGGLCCQTFSEYLALKRTYETKQHGDVALLAWRARNLLELWVWVIYCTKGRENARRLSQQALSDGIESLEGPYKRVGTAAGECGIGEQFGLSYKMLSKLAHPTATQIVAAPNEAREALQRDNLYGEGCRFFSGAFNALERELLAKTYDPVGRVIVNQYGSQRDEEEVTVHG
jgi:hypothetical protein